MANSVCNYLISQNIGYDCKDPVTTGVEPNGIIVNREDIDFGSTQFVDGMPNCISQLKLKEGKHGYSIVQGGKTPFTGTNTAFAEGNLVNTFTHVVSFVVLDNGADVCENIIDKLANGQFLVILENSYKGLNKDTHKGSAAFQIYGYYQGLKASEISNDKYSEDTNGGWLVNLQEEKSPKSGVFLFNTDYEGSKTAFDALLEAQS